MLEWRPIMLSLICRHVWALLVFFLPVAAMSVPPVQRRMYVVACLVLVFPAAAMCVLPMQRRMYLGLNCYLLYCNAVLWWMYVETLVLYG